jgi:glycosyltransferase involved in cell wall biosynthesis
MTRSKVLTTIQRESAKIEECTVMPKLSVIIPCFNAEQTIVIQLQALADQEWWHPWELIVVDNGSTDTTPDIVKACRPSLPSLRLIQAKEREGPAYARNVGAAAARSDALAFIDADDVVAPGWLAAMGEALELHDFVAGRKEVKLLNEPWVRRSLDCEEDEGVLQFTYLPFAGASNLGIRRSVHDAIGGFDEAFRFIQDVDYCWRVQQAGTRLEYIPGALVHFRLRHRLRDIFRRAWGQGSQEMLLYNKHRRFGAPKISWKAFVKAALVLTRDILLLKVASKEGAARWLNLLGWRAGNLYGYVKFGVSPF